MLKKKIKKCVVSIAYHPSRKPGSLLGGGAAYYCGGAATGGGP